MTSHTSSDGDLTAISLFASSGVGDLALRAAGAQVLVANEYVATRADLFKVNFPDCRMIVGDIREVTSDVVEASKEALNGRELDVLFATPPCQGMSKNGRGKLLRGVRDGLRDALDPRNQLATFVPPIVDALMPRLVVFENVPEMLGTMIEDAEGNLVELVESIARALPDYVGCWQVVEFADYGVPQRRKRLITIFLRRDLTNGRADDLQSALELVFPEATHSSNPTNPQSAWITVEDSIGQLPPLDASSKTTARDDSIDFHYVPVLDPTKYFWVSNTSLGSSAFDNQCISENCGFADNPIHGATRSSGINQSRRDTPLYCARCGSLLPRPTVKDSEGHLRLMKGFTSAYKRMRGDLPASAMTRNLSYACSDQKLHPTQHRVLSLLEAMMLQTITDYDYEWSDSSGRRVSDKLIRDTIGESVPPRGLEIIFRHLFEVVLVAS